MLHFDFTVGTQLRSMLLISLLLFGTLPHRAQSAEWTTAQVPGLWDADGADTSQTAWYRCYVKVPDRWVSEGARRLWIESVTLKVSRVADAHEVYINGRRIGGAGSMPPGFKSGLEVPSRYKVPPGLLKKGEYNCIAFRVHGHNGPGGFKGEAPVISGYFLECVLEGRWEFRPGDDVSWAVGPQSERPEVAGFDEFRDAVTAIERPAQLLSGTGIPPGESLAKVRAEPEFEVEIVLAEPDVAQPLQLQWDERGRLWVVEYRQYPFPAGIKMISRDKYYRATYDRVPEAPPNHVPGADRISIHEDTNGDGNFDSHKSFVDGLNIASAVALGRGGVWVLNAPYLLFYPDENRDDIADGDPITILKGFGMEDTHSVANSLTWGPDGWLYGAHGSTTASRLERPGVAGEPVYIEGVAIWRYHPLTRKLEVFAEGGGNAFGIEFDAAGRLFSGHNGGNTRGFHYLQGGYYNLGNTAKYGPPTNPYVFGEMPAMAHDQVPRFTHTFVVYEASALSQKYHGKMFCVDPLHRNIVLAQRLPHGSTLKTEDLGFPLESDDTAFRPVDIKVGPDGAIYVADFYEEFIAHGQHFQGQVDPTNGRVYRIREKGSAAQGSFDLGSLSTSELIETLGHEDKWFRQTAQRILADRRDPSAIPELKKLALAGKDQDSLEALWALHNAGGLDDQTAGRLLKQPNRHVRAWVVRFLTGDFAITDRQSKALARLAAKEPSPLVRAELAASARRIEPTQALALLTELTSHKDDTDDPHIPLMLWLVLERICSETPDQAVAFFENKALWQRPLVTEHLLDRVMRRFAMTGSRADLNRCARLLKLAPDDSRIDKLMAGFEAAFEGREVPPFPDALAEALAATGRESLVLKVRRGDSDAVREALAIVRNPKADTVKRQLYARTFGEIDQPTSVPVLLEIAQSGKAPAPLRKTALTALLNYSGEQVIDTALELFNTAPPAIQPAVETLIASRGKWAGQFLEGVSNGSIQRDRVTPEFVNRLRLPGNEKLTARIDELFPRRPQPSQDELKKDIERLTKVIEHGTGNIYKGKQMFALLCAPCHQLFGKGGRIGPDLTSYQRDDLGTMLISIVNPNAEIREGFENFAIETRDGRHVSGFLADQDNQVVIVRGLDGQNISIERDNIKAMKPVGSSLMPAGLLSSFDDQQVRDLFAYLRTGQPISRD